MLSEDATFQPVIPAEDGGFALHIVWAGVLLISRSTSTLCYVGAFPQSESTQRNNDRGNFKWSTLPQKRHRNVIKTSRLFSAQQLRSF
jgi:hypothetical protein